VALPVFRAIEHHVFQHVTQARAGFRRQQLLFNCGQREQRFTQGEGERRANFQNGKVIFNQLAQRLRRLVIGGVRFKYQRVITILLSATAFCG
jgi:hypothetical protein